MEPHPDTLADPLDQLPVNPRYLLEAMIGALKLAIDGVRDIEADLIAFEQGLEATLTSLPPVTSRLDQSATGECASNVHALFPRSS